VLLDVFSFSAVYAPTAEIGGFVVDDAVKEECARYICVRRLRIGSQVKTSLVPRASRESMSSSASQASTAHSREEEEEEEEEEESESKWTPSHTTLIALYTSLRQGLSLKNWVLNNLNELRGIDVRRLITFGIIKGFLYRVHKYAVATTSTTTLPPAPPTSLATSTANLHDANETATMRGGSHTPLPPGAQGQGQVHPSFSLHRPSVAQVAHNQQSGTTPNLDSQEMGAGENALPMLKFLDGMHCFDEICTELSLSEKEVETRVKGMGDGLSVIIQR
jgi:hypothetical protein